MPFQFEVVRPDDLLRLTFQCDNLRLDIDHPDAPALVVDNAHLPAFLTVFFPPQSITETAFFESSLVTPDGNKPDPDGPSTVSEPLPGAGNVKARVAHPSRLVFKIPAQARIPYTVEGVLDWSGLELSVNPIAAVPPNPTQQQIDAAPSIASPKPTETALELPYRLTISPNAAVRWAHRLEPFTSRGRTELWHTRLQLATTSGPVELSEANPAPLRAIFSEDYNAIHPPAPTLKDADLGRTAMAPNDRHQIVILTSAFHGYEVDEQILIPFGGGIGNRIASIKGLPMKFTVPYVPQPFFADQLMLSSLGGWLTSRGQWNPPRTAKPKQPPVFQTVGDLQTKFFNTLQLPERRLASRTVSLPVNLTAVPVNPVVVESPPWLGGILLPQPEQEQLDLSEWAHIATQGRDHYVRIVYEGELWPFRNRAALIKVTERKFKEQNGVVVAYLFQHMFIVVREPLKTFAFSDRGMPYKQVRLTTLVTPDIADPSLIAGTQRSFWVEVTTGASSRARFKFHAIGTDVAGNETDFTIPMMFVSIRENATNRANAATAYNSTKTANDLTQCSAIVPGQKIVFAERNAANPTDNTQLVTEAINFVMDTAGNAPAMLKADVKIPQVQQLLGSDSATTIRYFQQYVKSGIDAKTGVFAEIVKEDFSKLSSGDLINGLVANTVGVEFQSNQAGGFATPNLGISSLTRELGPLAGKTADALIDKFDPSTFFQKGMAQLFGSFDLTDLLPSSSMGTNAPKLRTSSKDIAGGKLLIATLDWEPEVQNVDLGVAAFEKDYQGRKSKLLIHGRIEKPVTLNSLGNPVAQNVTADFDGKLNDFRVSVLKSVYLNFTEFGFTAKSKSKADVSVKLDPARPVEFAGDLKFVEELRKAIPPDLFGDGPSLDISPTGIRAGFAFALPPVAVGIFALKDVSLGAALTLPFLDGKPAFDFNVSERAHPFLLSVAIFGGGGFFHLQIDTAGIKLVEAAFEFGASASIDLGVASGGVQIMAGIYFKLERQDPGNQLAPTLSGYLRMGGYLSILGLIKISLEFMLSFTYHGAKDKAYGRATLTVKIEILFFSKSVEVTVEKSFGGHSGDPKFLQVFTDAPVWAEYAGAFA
ncbi:hypothetical protein [Edaphobacter albus]|uniref:hypothetical protein n=1 Tax=Edaphobacter sp. 4G125 TaxID=2763071 RepID=UPI001647DF6C|nr:hypothetical protein [Edaphobacter sp. 4G125]QNI37036.1 hypothetical protein H7846_01465 [Edaphobacter sp. 4G125]